ncbi:MAG: hypothetical protein WA324_16700 [Bryobacteraceae bacterium]
MNILWVLLALAACLWGHGGVLLLHQQAGPYVVSLFSADAPLRAGSQDFTVLLQNAADGTPQLDANVTLIFRNSDAKEQIEARAGQSANKLLYAASAHLFTGVWNVTITIHSPAGFVATTKNSLTILDKQPPVAAYWPYFALIPAAILLFILNRHLKNRTRTVPH